MQIYKFILVALLVQWPVAARHRNHRGSFRLTFKTIIEGTREGRKSVVENISSEGKISSVIEGKEVQFLTIIRIAGLNKEGPKSQSNVPVHTTFDESLLDGPGGAMDLMPKTDTQDGMDAIEYRGWDKNEHQMTGKEYLDNLLAKMSTAEDIQAGDQDAAEKALLPLTPRQRQEGSDTRDGYVQTVDGQRLGIFLITATLPVWLLIAWALFLLYCWPERLERMQEEETNSKDEEGGAVRTTSVDFSRDADEPENKNALEELTVESAVEPTTSADDEDQNIDENVAQNVVPKRNPKRRNYFIELEIIFFALGMATAIIILGLITNMVAKFLRRHREQPVPEEMDI